MNIVNLAYMNKILSHIWAHCFLHCVYALGIHNSSHSCTNMKFLKVAFIGERN